MNVMLTVSLLTAVFGGVIAWLGLGIHGVLTSNIIVAIGMGIVICALVFAAGLT